MSRLSAVLNGAKGSVSQSGSQLLGSRARWEFTPEAIVVPYEQAKKKNLERIGALTRKYAMESMTHQSGESAPGSPPNSHSGLLKDSIFYRVENEGVTIGPAQFSTRVGYSVPDILEFGGSVTRLIWSYRRRRRIAVEKRIQQNFAPRPYMGPAAVRAQKSWIELWRDALFG